CHRAGRLVGRSARGQPSSTASSLAARRYRLRVTRRDRMKRAGCPARREELSADQGVPGEGSGDGTDPAAAGSRAGWPGGDVDERLGGREIVDEVPTDAGAVAVAPPELVEGVSDEVDR